MPPPRVNRPPASNSSSATVKRPALGDDGHACLVARALAPVQAPARPGSGQAARSTASACLEQRLVGRAVRVIRRLDLGLDALAGDRGAVGSEVLADREVETAAGVEIDHLLEHTLSVGPGADHGSQVVLAEGGGEDLRRRRGVAVDQYDARLRRDRVADRVVDRAPLGPRVGGDDRPVLDEDAAAEHRLLEQAAAVVAQIQDQALGPLARRSFSISLRSASWTPGLKLTSARSRPASRPP